MTWCSNEEDQLGHRQRVPLLPEPPGAGKEASSGLLLRFTKHGKLKYMSLFLAISVYLSVYICVTRGEIIYRCLGQAKCSSSVAQLIQFTIVIHPADEAGRGQVSLCGRHGGDTWEGLHTHSHRGEELTRTDGAKGKSVRPFRWNLSVLNV